MYTTFSIGWLFDILRGTGLLGPLMVDRLVPKMTFEMESGEPVDVNPLEVHLVRRHLLAILGQSAAFDLMALDGSIGEAEAAQETGGMIHEEAVEALRLLNKIQKEKS